jgi:transcriptional regulator with XRE-family HTH domain
MELGNNRLSHALIARLIAGESPVRIWRLHRGLTVETLAEKAGIKLQTLVRLEAGSTYPAPVTYALARVLEVDAEALLPCVLGSQVKTSARTVENDSRPTVSLADDARSQLDRALKTMKETSRMAAELEKTYLKLSLTFAVTSALLKSEESENRRLQADTALKRLLAEREAGTWALPLAYVAGLDVVPNPSEPIELASEPTKVGIQKRWHEGVTLWRATCDRLHLSVEASSRNELVQALATKLPAAMRACGLSIEESLNVEFVIE